MKIEKIEDCPKLDESYMVTGLNHNDSSEVYSRHTLEDALRIYTHLKQSDYSFVRLAKELEVKETVTYKLA